MAITYSREAGSKFPDASLPLKEVRDINDRVKDVIQQYYSFILNGNINSALALKANHPELDDYWIDAAKINLLQEELYNIGIYAQLRRGSVISDTEPTLDYAEGTFWYQEVE